MRQLQPTSPRVSLELLYTDVPPLGSPTTDIRVRLVFPLTSGESGVGLTVVQKPEDILAAPNDPPFVL